MGLISIIIPAYNEEEALGQVLDDVIATMAIYDVMQILTCPVATYCVGQAASGAAVLLAGGSAGKRPVACRTMRCYRGGGLVATSFYYRRLG